MKWKVVSNPMRTDGVFLCQDVEPDRYPDGKSMLPPAVVTHQMPRGVAEKIAAEHNKIVDELLRPA